MSDNGYDLVIVGGGNMGTALLRGVLRAATIDVERLAVVEVLAAKRDELTAEFGSLAVFAAMPQCRSAVLAVKPDGIPAAAQAAVAGGAKRLLSIAAGVTIARLEAAAGTGIAIVRCMPNTPAMVGLGASAIVGGSSASAEDLDWAEELLSAVGIVERLPESMIDAFTAVAGSGPAYLYLVAEALIAAAIGEGLPPDVAERAVTQTLLGSATLLDRDGDPARLRDQVTSPGGTTAAGIRVLEDQGMRATFADTVRAAAARSRELG